MLHTFSSLTSAVTRQQIAASLSALLASSVAEGLGVLMLLPLLHLAGVGSVSADADAVTRWLQRVFAVAGAEPSLPAVLVLYVGIAVLQSALQRWQAVAGVRLEQGIVTALRQRVYRAIGGAEWIFLARQRVSDSVHVLTAEIERAGAAVYYTIDLLGAAAVALVYFALAFAMSPVITVGVGAFGLILAAVLHRHLATAKASGRELSAAVESLYAALAEHLGGLKTAMSFGVVDRHEAAFAQLADTVQDVRVRAAVDYGRFRQRMGVGSAAGLAVVVYIALAKLAMPTAELLVLLFIFARLMPRVTGLYEKSQLLAAQLPAFEAVLGFEQRASEAARPAVDSSPAIACHREISLDRVTFAYDMDRGEPAVLDLSLTIAVGATTAIVGSSGSGKSTIADLLMGLVRPSAGRVFLDGCALAPDNAPAWRRQIGYVPQETFLFHDSIRANLSWAQPDASESELWHALQLAAADDFVRRLPQGLDTVVGDRGVLMSGGERQRLSLARALVRRASRAHSRRGDERARFRERIADSEGHRAAASADHRRDHHAPLSTIRHADAIHVVEKGRVIQTGTWDELPMVRDGPVQRAVAGAGSGR